MVASTDLLMHGFYVGSALCLNNLYDNKRDNGLSYSEYPEIWDAEPHVLKLYRESLHCMGIKETTRLFPTVLECIHEGVYFVDDRSYDRRTTPHTPIKTAYSQLMLDDGTKYDFKNLLKSHNPVERVDEGAFGNMIDSMVDIEVICNNQANPPIFNDPAYGMRELYRLNYDTEADSWELRYCNNYQVKSLRRVNIDKIPGLNALLLGKTDKTIDVRKVKEKIISAHIQKHCLNPIAYTPTAIERVIPLLDIFRKLQELLGKELAPGLFHLFSILFEVGTIGHSSEVLGLIHFLAEKENEAEKYYLPKESSAVDHILLWHRQQTPNGFPQRSMFIKAVRESGIFSHSDSDISYDNRIALIMRYRGRGQPVVTTSDSATHVDINFPGLNMG